MLAFGFLFSWFYEREEARSIFASRAFIHGLVFASLFNMSVVFLYLLAPDWMWMYYTLDSRVGVPGLIYILIFLYYIPFVLGYMLGARWRARRPWGWIPGLVASLAVEAAIVGILFQRYYRVGTTTEFMTRPSGMMTLADFPGYQDMGIIINTFFAGLAVYLIFLVWLFKFRKKSET